jgi:hypothetical protein
MYIQEFPSEGFSVRRKPTILKSLSCSVYESVRLKEKKSDLMR